MRVLLHLFSVSFIEQPKCNCSSVFSTAFSDRVTGFGVLCDLSTQLKKMEDSSNSVGVQ